MTLEKSLLVWVMVAFIPESLSISYGKYKFVLFSLEDINTSPLPRTNKFVIKKDNVTVLAQLTPAKGRDDSMNSQLVSHFFWLGAMPHLKLSCVNRSVNLPFMMELFHHNKMVAWRCYFSRSLLFDHSATKGGQWAAEISLSRGSGFLSTRASVTDLRHVAWGSWPWGRPVAAATVAPRVGRLRYMQDPCGGDLGLLYAVTAADKPGVFVATVIGNQATWYDVARMPQLEAAFRRSGGRLPKALSLTSGVLTSAHLFLLTSHGLIVTSAFHGHERRRNFTLTRLLLRRGNASLADQMEDELVHSPSCFTGNEGDEVVLLLLHTERRYLLGRTPFHHESSWRDVSQLVPWPASLTGVKHMRYNWHLNAVFVGYYKGEDYRTLLLPLDQTDYKPRPPSSQHAPEAFILLCPLTKKVLLLAGQIYASVDGGVNFERALSNLTFGPVKYCATDLINYHICVTENLELVVINSGTNAPKKILLKDIFADLNATVATKTAVALDRAGGITVHDASPTGIGSHYFNIENDLPEQDEPTCEYRLALLGDAKHTSLIHLDVHDIVTVIVEARRVHNEGAPASALGPLLDLELSNPDIVHVRRVSTKRGNRVRLAATVRPRTWKLRGVCAVVFRLPRASALCMDTMRVVNFALQPTPYRSVVVDAPPGADPKVEADVLRHLRAGDRSFYQLPVNYRPPSDQGVSIPTSSNIYNADPSRPINSGLLIVHEASRVSGRFKACAGRTNRSSCGCTVAAEFSTDVNDSDCRRYVPQISWPAKLRLTMSIRESGRPSRPLRAPMYVIITELNNRSSWYNHVLLDANLAYIYSRNLSAWDRQLVDPQRIRLLMTGTGLYHFRIRVVEHTSYNRFYDDLMVYVVASRLKSQVQHVVYPVVGITLIVMMFVVFEYYHQRYVDAADISESEEDTSSEERDGEDETHQ